MTPTNPAKSSPIRPLAGALAWLLPGLGHIIIGQRTRGLIIMISLCSLYALGLLIGGIDVIDAKEDQYWFAGQALFSPITFGIQTLRESLDVGVDYHKSIGRTNEIGTLYCAMAGLLNLLVILNALIPTTPQADPKPNTRGKVLTQEDAS